MVQVQALSKGEQTRERLLDIAQDAVLHKGFAGTSLDEIICEAGITKSGFFYHFRDKNDLAKALLQRYLDNEWRIFDDLFRQADELSDDPLHNYLIFLKLFADLLGDIPNGHPGCLVASYVYQDYLFSQEVRRMTTEGHRIWRTRFRERLDRIAARYPPKIEIDLNDMADMLSSVADGAIILSKSLSQPDVLPRQVMQYRAYVKLVFSA
ncbi:MAG: TetR/AcrR family transcriptional regulator [Hyphomonadaceae bacterium JAD_PAG50586_4]|nr:MAG: TetR/AcrR family transcriptional regulator [Hyphomonadaceae bacterium JAD_PAG50586_4]